MRLSTEAPLPRRSRQWLLPDARGRAQQSSVLCLSHLPSCNPPAQLLSAGEESEIHPLPSFWAANTRPPLSSDLEPAPSTHCTLACSQACRGPSDAPQCPPKATRPDPWGRASPPGSEEPLTHGPPHPRPPPGPQTLPCLVAFAHSTPPVWDTSTFVHFPSPSPSSCCRHIQVCCGCIAHPQPPLGLCVSVSPQEVALRPGPHLSQAPPCPQLPGRGEQLKSLVIMGDVPQGSPVTTAQERSRLLGRKRARVPRKEPVGLVSARLSPGAARPCAPQFPQL